VLEGGGTTTTTIAAVTVGADGKGALGDGVPGEAVKGKQGGLKGVPEEVILNYTPHGNIKWWVEPFFRFSTKRRGVESRRSFFRNLTLSLLSLRFFRRSSLEVDTRDREFPRVNYELWIDGKLAWQSVVLRLSFFLPPSLSFRRPRLELTLLTLAPLTQVRHRWKARSTSRYYSWTSHRRRTEGSALVSPIRANYYLHRQTRLPR